MATQGKVTISVTADGVQTTVQGVEQVQGSLTELNQGVELVKNAFGALGGVMGGLKSAFIDGNAEMERYLTSFEVMTGSADMAKAHLEDLKKFGAETPFELPGLAKNSTLLQSFGVSVDDVLPALQMLGDISGGSAEKLDSLTMVFAQVRSAGKLQGGDLLQMINAGFNPLNEIAKKTGKSMAQLKDEMSKGQISYQMVEDAMKAATSEGGQFYGMMAKQAETFDGMMSTLQDTFGEFMREAGQPFFAMAKHMTGAIQFLLDAMGPLRPVITPIIAAVGLLTAALTAYSAVTSLTAVKTVLLTTVENAKKVATLISTGVTWAATAAQWALNAAMSANPIGLIVLGIGALVAAIVGLAAWIIDLVGGWDSVNKVMSKVWEFLKQGLILFLKFGNPIGLLITALGWLYDKFDFVKVAIDAVWEAIKAVGQAIADAASWIGDVLGLSGDEQVAAVEAAEQKKVEVVEKSYEEQAKEIEAGMKKQLQVIELNEARGVVSKEKAATMKLELERKYWADLKALQEKNGRDTSEAELKQAQAEQKIREEARERAKKRREAQQKEEDQYQKLRIGNIEDATERLWEQYTRDVENADKALKSKEITQRVHDETIKSLIAKLKADIAKIEKEGNDKAKEEQKKAFDEILEARELHAAEVAQREEERQRDAALRDAARQAQIDALPNEIARIDAKYAYELDALDRALLNEEMLVEEYNARRAMLDRQYADDRTTYALDQSKQMFDGMSKLLGENTEAGKAAGLASAMISTYTAAAKALEVGPIMGPIFAAIITAQGLAQVAKIAATKTPGRRAGGPVTSGFYQVGEEGEEFVMNARATAQNRTLLEAMNAGAAPGQSFSQIQPPAPALSRSVVDLNGKFILDGRTAYVLVEQEVAIQRGNTL